MGARQAVSEAISSLCGRSGAASPHQVCDIQGLFFLPPADILKASFGADFTFLLSLRTLSFERLLVSTDAALPRGKGWK